MSEKIAVVAVDIGGTKIAAGIVLFGKGAPQVSNVTKVPTNAAAGGSQVLAHVIQQVEATQKAAHEQGIELAGVGISSAGVINPLTGDVTFANEIMPGWTGTKLASEVQIASGLPTKALNDVHAHALGEARWGAGKGSASCLVMAVGTGIGGAFIFDNHILRGAHDVAGSIGHVLCEESSGMPCACGRSSHLETIAAGPGIIDSYVEFGGSATLEDGTPINGADIDKRALAGDEAAQRAEARSGHAIGTVLGSMCNMLDPHTIVLSGSVAQCSAYWHNALAEGFASQAMDPVAQTPILEGKLGGNAPLIGAAENFLTLGYAL